MPYSFYLSQKMPLGMGDGQYSVIVNIANLYCNSTSSDPIPNLQCAQSSEGDTVVITNQTTGASKTFPVYYVGFNTSLQAVSDIDGLRSQERIEVTIDFFPGESGGSNTGLAEINVVVSYALNQCSTK